MRVDLVTRKGCHLCDEAEAALVALGLVVRPLDVDADPELNRLYDFRVPVVLRGRRVVAEGRVVPAELERALRPLDVVVQACGPEAAADVHRLTRAAFEGLGELAPPSAALAETLEVVLADLARGGGAIARQATAPGPTAVGCLRLEAEESRLRARRIAVDPGCQGRGVGSALMAWVEREAEARGLADVAVSVRLAVVADIEFYRRLGFEAAELTTHPGFDRPTAVVMVKRVTTGAGRLHLS